MMKTALTMILAFCCAWASAKDELNFPGRVAEVKVAPGQDLVTVTFPFKNTSDREVKLGKIRSTCDCTNASYRDSKTVLAPGEQGVVEASMTTGTFSGTVEKQVIVNAMDTEYKLTVKAVIPEIVSMTPRKLEWAQGDERKPKTIVVKLDPKFPMNLTKVSLSNEYFDYQPVTVTAGREYKVIVTPKSTGKPCLTSIWVLTDSTMPRYSRLLGFLTVSSKK